MKLTVKQARLLSGMTQELVAEKMGIHVQTYRKMESEPESVTIKKGRKFARIVGRGFDEIFFGDDSSLNGGET